MNKETLSAPRYCTCDEPQKKFHTIGCFKFWDCEKCGAYGGCENLAWNWPEDLFPKKRKMNIKFVESPIKWQGCTNTWTCPKCKVEHVSNTNKAGIREGNVRYIAGPCACGMSKCSECDYELKFEFNNDYKMKVDFIYTKEDYQI